VPVNPECIDIVILTLEKQCFCRLSQS